MSALRALWFIRIRSIENQNSNYSKLRDSCSKCIIEHGTIFKKIHFFTHKLRERHLDKKPSFSVLILWFLVWFFFKTLINGKSSFLWFQYSPILVGYLFFDPSLFNCGKSFSEYVKLIKWFSSLRAQRRCNAMTWLFRSCWCEHDIYVLLMSLIFLYSFYFTQNLWVTLSRVMC